LHSLSVNHDDFKLFFDFIRLDSLSLALLIIHFFCSNASSLILLIGYFDALFHSLFSAVFSDIALIFSLMLKFSNHIGKYFLYSDIIFSKLLFMIFSIQFLTSLSSSGFSLSTISVSSGNFSESKIRVAAELLIIGQKPTSIGPLATSYLSSSRSLLVSSRPSLGASG
jgi:hypothetical protein